MFAKRRERKKLKKERKRLVKERDGILHLRQKLFETYRYEFALIPSDLLTEYDESAAQVLDLNLRIAELTDRINDI